MSLKEYMVWRVIHSFIHTLFPPLGDFQHYYIQVNMKCVNKKRSMSIDNINWKHNIKV